MENSGISVDKTSLMTPLSKSSKLQIVGRGTSVTYLRLEPGIGWTACPLLICTKFEVGHFLARLATLAIAAGDRWLPLWWSLFHRIALLMLSLMAPWVRLYLAHNKSYNLINTLLTLTATCAARILLTSIYVIIFR